MPGGRTARTRGWRRGLVLLGAAGLVAVGATGPLRPPPNVRVTMDAANRYAQLDGTTDPTMTRCGGSRWGQDEPSIAIDPREPAVVVAGANDTCPATFTGFGWAGYYRSTDGGATWRDSLVPGYPNDVSAAGRAAPEHGTCPEAGDPTVSFDAQGSLFYGFICLKRAPLGDAEAPPESAAAYVATFDRDGARYARTALVAGGDPTHGLFEDKIDLAVDRTGGAGAGNVYVAWAEFGSAQGSVIEFARSTDHGQTFSPAVAPDPADEHQQFADIAVGPDGTVYVALRSRDRLVVTRSTDQGRSFAVADSFVVHPLDSWYFSGTRSHQDCGDARDACPSGFTFPRFDTQPALAVDAAGAHLVWSESRPGGQGKVMAVTSADGVHWGAAARPVDLWPRGHQIMPAIGSTDGVLAVVFYDSRDDPAYDPKRPPGNTPKGVSSGPSVSVMLARSTDGGATWSEARVTPRPMSLDYETADALRVPFVGDYLAVSAVDGTFALAWTDTRDVRPGPDVREQGTALDDHDGFDTFAPCHWDPGSLSADRFTAPDPDDRCLRMGGLDQNIYATILPARSGGMPVA